MAAGIYYGSPPLIPYHPYEHGPTPHAPHPPASHASDAAVAELRREMGSMLARAEAEVQRSRAESDMQYAHLREENSELRAANTRLADNLEARQRESASSMHATLDERNRTVAAIEAQIRSLQSEHERQTNGVLSTLEERTSSVQTLEAQLASVQSQLMSVLQAQLQQRDDVRKLASSSSLQDVPLSSEEAEPPLEAPVTHASSGRLVGTVAQLQFGDLAEHREALGQRLSLPRRSVRAEFASNEGGMWLREYEYVVTQPARQRRHVRTQWQLGAPDIDEDELGASGGAGEGMVVRDEGHDGWTLDDFCARPLARAAGLTKPEVALLRLFTGPCHAPLQFFMRTAASGEVLSCTGRPYHVHLGGERRAAEPFLFVSDHAHRAATGEERCVRCRRPRREHACQPVQDWSTSCALLCSAIEKLAMWSPPMTAYRPLREEEGSLPVAFVPRAAEPARRVSAADRGVLCATTDRQVALAFSGGRAAHASILEIGFDYSSHGASLQWLSQYPREAEVVYLPCTTLSPQAVRSWGDWRRVLCVHATPTSLRVRTDAITALDADPSGAVQAIASAVTSGVNGLGASLGVGSVGSSVARKLWGGGAAATSGATPIATDGAADHVGSRSTLLAFGGGRGYRAGTGASTPAAMATRLDPPPPAPTSTASGLADRAIARPYASAATEVAVAGSAGSPPMVMALQQELVGELRQVRTRSATREQVIATRAASAGRGVQSIRVGGGAARGGDPDNSVGAGGGAAEGTPDVVGHSGANGGSIGHVASDQLVSFGFGIPAVGVAPTAEERKAVLTINDALKMLEEGAQPPPAREKSAAELRVQRRLEAAKGHLEHAAGLEEPPPTAARVPRAVAISGEAMAPRSAHQPASTAQSSGGGAGGGSSCGSSSKDKVRGKPGRQSRSRNQRKQVV